MRQGTAFTKIAILVLFLGLVAYLGGYAWNSFHNPFSTAYAYTATENTSVTADGILVRSESVVQSPNGIVDLNVGEGENVAVGEDIADIYQDSAAQDRQVKIASLKQEATDLQAALSASSGTTSSARLDEDIINELVALRFSGAQRSFSSLEDQVSALKSSVLQRAYTYGGADDASSLQAQLTDLLSQISALEAQSGSAVSSVSADNAGIFSALVDGYETLITPDNMADFTPSSLKELLSRNVTENTAALGKIITSSHWYLVASVSGDTSWLAAGDQYTVHFSGDYDGDISMRVSSVGDEEDGQRVVVLASSRYLSQMTLLRKQTVEIISRSVTGIRIPLESLRFDDSGQTGVYVLVGARAEFKPVTLLSQGDDYCLVSSVATDKTALRSGDEIIVSAKDLYDGKIVK